MRDLTGKTFGRLVAQWPAGANRQRHISWLCVCECGGLRVARADSLLSGRASSCGCVRREFLASGKAHLTHGNTRHRRPTGEYHSWRAMLSRCENKRSHAFADYGGRGIKVCKSWHDFVNFLRDMGPRLVGTTLERKDVNDDYRPGNCCWATVTEQNRNRRNVKAKRAHA